jgi:hypothetical protein
VKQYNQQAQRELATVEQWDRECNAGVQGACAALKVWVRNYQPSPPPQVIYVPEYIPQPQSRPTTTNCSYTTSGFGGLWCRTY